MKTAIKNLSKNKGQMLVVVLLVMVILMVLLLAVVVNLRADIRETQSEREYEKGYDISENEVFQMAQNIDGWKGIHEGELGCAGSLNCCPDGYDPNEVDESTCLSYELTGLGDDGLGTATCWEYEINHIRDVEIYKDEALEVNLDGYAGEVTIDYDVKPSILTNQSGFSIGVVSSNSTDYFSRKLSVKCDPSWSNFYTLNNMNGFTSYSFDISAYNLIPSGSTTAIMRIRAIIGGNDPSSKMIFTDVHGEEGSNFPNQMVEYRCKSRPSGIEGGQPEPDVYTRKMLRHRLPSIFDYVLFVGEGAVEKP